jgi:co-chaperonin GroES (HSP10)
VPLLKESNLTEGDRINPEDVRLLRDEIAAKVIYESSHVGSFYIPKEARRKTNMARVVALGEQYKGPLEVGMIVIYGTWEGREWPGDPDEETMLLAPDNVHGIVDVDS